MAEPKLRFPEFKDSWKEHKFCDFTYAAGKRNKENLPLEPYSITNIDGFIAQSDAHDEFGYMKDTDRSAYIIVQPQSFGYNPARINVGSLGFYSGKQDVIVSSLYEVFKTTDVIDDNFLEQWFKTHTFQNWIERLQEGSVRQYFYYDKLCECRLHVPCIDEQKKISETIKGIDNLITVLVEEIRLWEEKKKGVIQKIFSQEVRFKDENGEDYPEWEERTVESLGEIVGGGTPSTSKSEYWNGDIPWISSADLVENNIFYVNAYRYTNQLGIKNSATKLIPKNSILIISRVGIGKVAVAPFDLCTSQDYMSIVDSKENVICLGYLISELMKRKSVEVQGTSIKGIPVTEIKKYKIKLPCLEEQQKIADCLSSIDEVIVIKKQKLEIWKTIKKGLLQQMFV